jgi:hypothetical protein
LVSISYEIDELLDAVFVGAGVNPAFFKEKYSRAKPETSGTITRLVCKISSP